MLGPEPEADLAAVRPDPGGEVAAVVEPDGPPGEVPAAVAGPLPDLDAGQRQPVAVAVRLGPHAPAEAVDSDAVAVGSLGHQH